MGEPNFAKMTSMHFYGWKNGLKTGQYYLRSKPSRDAIKFTVNIEQLLEATDQGDPEKIMGCLSLDQQKIIANDKTAGKRIDRLNSTKGYTDDDDKGFDDEEKRTRLEEIIEQNHTEEIDDVTFECLNCGS